MDISNTTRQAIPRHSYEKIKNYYFGPGYGLSLVFCGEKLSRRLNRETRGKDYSANILSFTLSETSGEIFIDLATAKKQHKKFNRTFSNYIAFLFIHGLVHLSGYDHGDTMEEQESRIREEFNV